MRVLLRLAEVSWWRCEVVRLDVSTVAVARLSGVEPVHSTGWHGAPELLGVGAVVACGDMRSVRRFTTDLKIESDSAASELPIQRSADDLRSHVLLY
jgi:hypothetical protein